MIIEIIIALVLGCFVGSITGLIPGLHTNTIAIIVLGSASLLGGFFSPFALAVFLISMVIVHSFVDFIPSIFFGAPEAETVLGVLPGHKMLLSGRGLDAIKLTVVGGIGTFVVGIISMPFVFLFLKYGYSYIEKIIAPLLLIFSILFILRERKARKIFWSIIIFILAGALGYVTLNQIDINQPLFPLLTGAFGISTLLISMSTNIRVCKQLPAKKINLLAKTNIISYFKAAVSSLITSILPAIGAAQAAIIAQGFTKFKNEEDFLVVLGGINTIAAIFTLTALFVLNKARTGVMATVKEIIHLSFTEYLLVLAVSGFAVLFAVIITLKLSEVFATKLVTFNYKLLSLGIILFILAMVFMFSGFIGLFVASIATSIGILAPIVGVRRIHAMGILVIPVVMYFI